MIPSKLKNLKFRTHDIIYEVRCPYPVKNRGKIGKSVDSMLYDIIITQYLLDIRITVLYNMGESNGKGDHSWNPASSPYPLIKASPESVESLTGFIISK